jgi:hypothetical protein
MDDPLKPRRSEAEEKAEIAAHFAGLRHDPQNSSLYELVEQRKEDEEAALQRREEGETGWERFESERIERVEAETEAERPYLRQRELRRIYARPIRRRHAA